MTQTVTFRAIVLVAAMGVAMAAAAGAAESSWYVVGKAGQSGVDERYGTPDSGGWGVDGEELSGGIEVGWAFHENLAVQGGYHFLGDYAGFTTAQPCTGVCPTSLLVPDNPTEASFQGVSLSLVPRWAASERFAVHGKLGYLDWDSDLTFDFGEQLGIVRPSGEDLLAGAGLEYGWPGGAGLLLEYEHAGPFDVVSLGGTWRF